MRKSYLWATAITLGLSLWMASPYIIPKLTGVPRASEAAEVPAEAPADKLFKVRVKTFTAIPRVAFVTANGITAASNRTSSRAKV
jgi:hypothetical protein